MSDTPRSDAHFGVLGIKQVRGTGRDLHFARKLERDADTLRKQLEAEIKRQDSEYICKCGIRVELHRCNTGEEF